MAKENNSWILKNSKIEMQISEEMLECTFLVRENGQEWQMNLSQTAGVAIGKPQTMKKLFRSSLDFDPKASTISFRGNVVIYPFRSPVKSQVDRDSVIFYFNTHGVDYRCMFRLDGEKPDVLFSITPLSFGEKQLLEAWFPGNMEPARAKIEWVAYPYGSQGLLYQGGGIPFTKYFKLGMSFWGAGTGESSYTAIIETPYDSVFSLSKTREDKIEAKVRWIRCMGSMNYTRRIRYSFLPQSSYVAVAKRYRKYAISRGLFKSLKEKMTEKPLLEKVVGSVITFTGIPVDDESVQATIEQTKKLKELGCKKAFVFPLYRGSQEWRAYPLRSFPSKEVREKAFKEIRGLGYVVGGWLLFYIINSSSVHYTAAMTVKNTDGSIVLGWRWPNAETLETCDAPQVCSIIGNEIMKKWEDEYLMADGFHYDTGTAGGFGHLIECHDPNHPHDRETEARKRFEMFGYLSSKGKIMSTEGFCDYAVPVCDISTSLEPPRFGRNNRWGEFEDTWTIPLIDLVYHDAIMRNLHEGSSYMSPRGGAFHEKLLQDILYNHPPLICLNEGWYGYARYEHGYGMKGEGKVWYERRKKTFRTIINDPEIQRRAKKSFEVASLHEHLGLLEMTDHQFLSVDGSVQKTKFENGSEIIVNFGEKKSKVEDLIIPPKSWKIMESSHKDE